MYLEKKNQLLSIRSVIFIYSFKLSPTCTSTVTKCLPIITECSNILIPAPTWTHSTDMVTWFEVYAVSATPFFAVHFIISWGHSMQGVTGITNHKYLKKVKNSYRMYIKITWWFLWMITSTTIFIIAECINTDLHYLGMLSHKFQFFWRIGFWENDIS